MSTIAQQVRELHRLTPAQLAHRYAEQFGKPPRVRNKAWLVRQCAFKLQEREFGSLSERARTRLDELAAGIDLPLAASPRSPKAAPTRADTNTPMVGTVLVREWRGQQIRVEVCEDGFVWNSTVYTSLSAVAKAITGANWNGRLFFGLTQRKAGA